MRSGKLYKSILAVSFFLLVATSALPQTAPPVILFTDLTSGPNTGGENNNGTILTIYGRNFGVTQGTSTVTVGGGAVAAVNQWGGTSKAGTAAAQLQTISVAIGSAAKTGTVVVTTANGASTCENMQDNCQFTVRTGNIYCVSTAGSDSNAGTFPSSCWKTIPHAVHTIAAGSTVYIENGVTQTAQDNYAAAVSVQTGCTSAAPCALVAYPGATATINGSSLSYAMRTPEVGGGPFNYWTIAGITFVAPDSLDLYAVQGWRIVNNDMSCPTGNGESACHHTDSSTYEYFYGNYVHDVGDQNTENGSCSTSGCNVDKYFHGIYYTTNSNHIWVGWNESNNNPNGSTTQGGCRGIQFYSTGGSNQFDEHVHDNYIHNAICDGINFSTVDPSEGTVEAYNNVVFHVGTGPDPFNGSSNYSCIVAGGGGSSNVLAYNNTFYDCGSRKTSDAGAFDPTGPAIAAYNNITYQLSGESYLNPNASASSLSGSNNIWYGLSSAPSQTSANISVSPLFSTAGTDFTLQSTSPAIGAGTSTQHSTWDFLGSGRPSPPSIGAYEYGSSTTVQRPNPPSGLAATVN